MCVFFVDFIAEFAVVTCDQTVEEWNLSILFRLLRKLYVRVLLVEGFVKVVNVVVWQSSDGFINVSKPKREVRQCVWSVPVVRYSASLPLQLLQRLESPTHRCTVCSQLY